MFTLTEEVQDTVIRLLQKNSTSRPTSNYRTYRPPTVTPTGRLTLTIIYLSFLFFCFVLPFIYYIKVCLQARREIRQYEEERAAAAEEEAEAAATRRKYKEERKARLLQLLEPVQKELKEKDFPHLKDSGGDVASPNKQPVGKPNEAKAPSKLLPDGRDVELGGVAGEDDKDQDPVSNLYTDDPYGEETTFIEVPAPGLDLLHAGPANSETRRVPNLCAICLCNYEVGDNVTWSSNPACEHVFHHNCISSWLVKEKNGPLCPCCRRHFVIDPLDVLLGDGDDDGSNENVVSMSNTADEDTENGISLNVAS